MLTPASCIKNLRRCLLIHHFLRDVMHCQVVPDETMRKWGAELRYNQYQFCLSAREVEYFDMFKAYDHTNPDSIKALKYDDEIRELAINIYKAHMEATD